MQQSSATKTKITGESYATDSTIENAKSLQLLIEELKRKGFDSPESDSLFLFFSPCMAIPTPEGLMKFSKLQSERVLVAPARNCPHRLVLMKNESDIFYISKCGTPGGTRTPDNQVRSLVL